MARAPALLGFGNYPNVAGFASTLVQTNALYEAPSLKAINLRTVEPSEVSRILTNLPLFSYWGVILGGGSAPLSHELTGFALINSNLSPGGMVRFLANSIQPPFVEYAPTAIAASANITGAVTAVDEDLDAPDANFIEPTTTTTAWSARFTFPTPVLPKTGAHMAMFALRMLLVDGGGTVSAHPVVTADLYENGALVRSLGTRPVSVSTGDGQLLYFTFDPAELSAPDCSNAEVYVFCSRGLGTASTYAKLNTVSFVVDDASLTGLGDSGWLPSPFAARPEYEGLDVPGSSVDVDYFPTGAAAAVWADMDRFVVLIRDDQATHDPQTSFGGLGGNFAPAAAVVRSPDGFVQAGVLVAGTALILERNPPLAPESRVIVEGYEGQTEGGQTYGADAFRFRAVSVVFTLNRGEKDLLLDGIDWRRGHASPYYINLEPDLPAQSKAFISGWVTTAEAGPAVQMPGIAYDTGDLVLFTKSYVFHEKL